MKDSIPRGGIVVLAILLVGLIAMSFLSAITPTVRQAEAQVRPAGADWAYVNYDLEATSLNPQTQITKDNIRFLELKWLYPLPSKPPANPLVGTDEGSFTVPLVIDGITYLYSNHLTLYAIDMGTGKLLWSWIYKADFKALQAALPWAGINRGHTHGIAYYDKTGLIYIAVPYCQIIGIDRLTGKEKFKLQEPWCKDVPGTNQAPYLGKYKSDQSYVHAVYDNVLLFGSAQPEGLGGGRGFIGGWDATTGALLWRFFLHPPASDKVGVPADPEWALRNADKGWIRGIKTSEIARVCRECLLNDWGDGKTSSNGIGWGQYAVDKETGIVYTATNQPSPYTNATYRPGPNLYSSSVIALKLKTGELVWYHQVSAHDMWDWDCAWNTNLGKIGDRKVVFKECKAGVFTAFDAATGERIWEFDPFTKKEFGFSRSPDNNANLLDPTNLAQMKKRWPTDPLVIRDKVWLQCPGNTGGIESDTAIGYGLAFVAAMNNCVKIGFTAVEPYDYGARGRTDTVTVFPQNTTLFALDIATGKPKWSYFIPQAYRGGFTLTGGMALPSPVDGTLRALDAQTGNVIWNKYMGVPMTITPVFATDAKGKMTAVQSTSARGGFGQIVPGALMAYALPDKLPEPQVITKEVVKEVPKEVVKEVVKEVPKEIIKEVVKEVPKEVVKEVVKEVPKEVTKTVTVETISPVSYAAIGVGVVLVVIAGVLFTRRKKA